MLPGGDDTYIFSNSTVHHEIRFACNSALVLSNIGTPLRDPSEEPDGWVGPEYIEEASDVVEPVHG